MFRSSSPSPAVFVVLLVAAFLSVPDESSFSAFVGRHLSGHVERKWGFSVQGLAQGVAHMQSKLGIMHARYDYFCFCLTKHLDYWFIGAFGLWIPLPTWRQLKLPTNSEVHLGAVEILILIYLTVFFLGVIAPGFMGRHFELSIENAVKRPWCMVFSNFSHDGAIHLVSNIQVIGCLVPHLEESLDMGTLFRLYLFGGIGAQMTSLVGNSLLHRTAWVSKGASGSMYALLACNAVMDNSQSLSFNVFGFNCSSVGLLVGRLMADIAILLAGGETGIDVWSHIGGLTSGIVFTKWLQGDVNVKLTGDEVGWRNGF
ncbi:hypothetical protein BSKO_06031 [Bryopsis sp. KO-2023]|nr:hypothetical protein BSKO_06031 [Bryopsis sp. KO-2023]